MEVSHITMNYGYCKFLEGLDQQMLKACIQDLVDYSSRTIIPGHSTTRVCKVPGARMENPTGDVLHHLIHEVFVFTALDVEIWPKEICAYDRPIAADASKDRLIFYGFSD
eukprot:8833120-Pyramimonas_sp.AAC.1